jgi:hypothetical protein
MYIYMTVLKPWTIDFLKVDFSNPPMLDYCEPRFYFQAVEFNTGPS